MANLGWTSRALARLLGIQPQTLNYWILGGLVNPLSTGIGRPGHKIGLDGLLEAITVHELRRSGFSLQAIRKSVDDLRTLTGKARPLAQLSLVVIGDDLVWRQVDEVDAYISAHKRPGQRILQFPISEQAERLLQTEVEAQIAT